MQFCHNYLIYFLKIASSVVWTWSKTEMIISFFKILVAAAHDSGVPNKHDAWDFDVESLTLSNMDGFWKFEGLNGL